MKEVIFLSCVFGISELALTLFRRSGRTAVKTKNDRGSLIILWVLMVSCITAGFFVAKYGNWTRLNEILAIAGFMIIVTGIIIRWKSILQLKERFTVDVAVRLEHKLENKGMYKHLRHPSYFGLLLILTGLGLAMNSLLSFLIVTVPVFIGLNYRIGVEEALLVREFGDEYIEFRSTRKKIIPYLY